MLQEAGGFFFILFISRQSRQWLFLYEIEDAIKMRHSL